MTTEIELARYWINQPSTLQPLHKYHGMNVIAAKRVESSEKTVYFTSGDTISIVAPTLCLSKGWNKCTQKK